jgi:hypothetical protein
MAKRFIDTELFDDPWFMDLSKDAKILWIYLITKCNHAGLIDVNEKLCKFQTGLKNIQTVYKELGNRLVTVKEQLIFIPKFIEFQYPNFPQSKVRQQASAIELLKKYNLFDEKNLIVNKELSNSYEDEHDTVIDNVHENIDFELFWNLYDKKVGKKEKVKNKWDKLTIDVQEKILDYLPIYIKSQPDKKFRKNPETFFNNESWNDEIISETSGIDKDILKEYYTKEYKGADDKTIKEYYSKFCNCIFNETKAWGDKPFFLTKIDKPLSYREFKIIYNTLKFSDSTYADWECIMDKIIESKDYYKNKKSVNEIFKKAIWDKLKIKVK